MATHEKQIYFLLKYWKKVVWDVILLFVFNFHVSYFVNYSSSVQWSYKQDSYSSWNFMSLVLYHHSKSPNGPHALRRAHNAYGESSVFDWLLANTCGEQLGHWLAIKKKSGNVVLDDVTNAFRLFDDKNSKLAAIGIFYLSRLHSSSMPFCYWAIFPSSF